VKNRPIVIKFGADSERNDSDMTKKLFIEIKFKLAYGRHVEIAFWP